MSLSKSRMVVLRRVAGYAQPLINYHERRVAGTVKATISENLSRKKPFSIAIVHLHISLDRCEPMTEAELDHSPDALGIGGW